jgi:hypothetical protein
MIIHRKQNETNYKTKFSISPISKDEIEKKNKFKNNRLIDFLKFNNRFFFQNFVFYYMIERKIDDHIF